MPRSLARVLLVLASTAVGAPLCYWLWSLRPLRQDVVIVDNLAEVRALLGARAATGGADLDPLDLEAPLRREPLDEDAVRKLFPTLGGGRLEIVYDPQTYYWELGGIRRKMRWPEHPRVEFLVQTNSLGFRKAVELRETPPDLRVLVTGDSHTAGVVPNSEQFGNLLEQLLDAADPTRTHEVLNGGKGGYAFYNYLGVLEKYLELDPDVFVLAVFGGNDFVGSVNAFRYFNHLPWQEPQREIPGRLRSRLIQEQNALAAQGFLQLLAFASRPGDERLAEVAACQVLSEVLRLCEREGIRFVYVYIPPCNDVQPELAGRALPSAVAAFELTEAELQSTNRVADRVLAFLVERGVQTIDMRPAYRASAEPCYWTRDLHINTLGHRLIAEALARELGAAGPR